jgi:hypothetical protein
MNTNVWCFQQMLPNNLDYEKLTPQSQFYYDMNVNLFV